MQQRPFQQKDQMTTPADPYPTPAATIGPLWAQLRAQPLEHRLWHELSRAYGCAGLAPQTAYAHRQYRRLQPRDDTQRTPVASVATGPTAAAAEGLLLQPEQPTARPWAAALRRWLVSCPGDWLSWLYLARLQDNSAEPSPDVALTRAESLEPIPGESRHWLGVWRLGNGDATGAVAALAPLVDRQPPRHGSLLQLGLALLRSGNRPAAEAAFSRASASTNPAFLRLLAQRVYEHNYWQEAIAVLERALSLAPDDLDSLLAQADVVSLHCPLTAETRGLIDAGRIARMKRGALLINTGRGPLLNEAEVAAALHSGQLGGAGLDVLSLEPPDPANPLLQAPNCVITPHIAWATRAARQRLIEAAAANAAALLAGAPQNVVNGL